jgi:hypothetical protein
VPEGLSVSANESGPDTCSFTLRREESAPFPDLLAYDACDVLVGGALVAPRGAEPALAPTDPQPLDRESGVPAQLLASASAPRRPPGKRVRAARICAPG